MRRATRLLVAAGALCAALILPSSAAHATTPTLTLASFSVDRNVNPRKTATARPLCRRGFELLSTRFTVTALSQNLSDPRNRPAIVLRSLVPERKGATFRFENSGGGAALVRATADCVRVSGKPSLQTSVRTVRPGGAGNREARAEKRVAISARCTEANSIPGDVGFELGKGAELAGFEFFERQGAIGVEARFRGTPEALHLTCVKGKGIALSGSVGKRTLAAVSPRTVLREPHAAKSPEISVRYGPVVTTEQPDYPFPSATGFVSESAMTPWFNPLPGGTVAKGMSWQGSALLNTEEASRRNQKGAPPSFETFFVGLFAGPISEGVEDLTGPAGQKLHVVTLGRLVRSEIGLTDVRRVDRVRPPSDDSSDEDDDGDATTSVECNDSIDNDGDGAIDSPNDRGCLSSMDTTEGHTDWTVEPVGANWIAWLTFKPRFTEGVPVLPAERYRVEFNPVLHESTTVQHGGQSINGASFCGSGTFEISAGVGSSAPTTSPTTSTAIPEAAPNEDHMRIVLEGTSTSGCPASINLRAAVDTR